MKKLAALIVLSILFSCKTETTKVPQINNENPLTLVAESDMLWTGLAISQQGRIFVNFPRWSKDVSISVGEIIDGKVVPYPNEGLNSWTSGTPFGESFVCVQSVYIDDKNHLWILDPANPYFQGVIESKAKLYQVDLNNNEIIKTYDYNTPIITSSSYLNDVRVDTEKGFAYITDSGEGAIITTNLKTGKSLRLLANDESVKANLSHLTFGENRIELEVHSDGIALNKDNSYLYYTPLSSHTLYRIKTEYLRNGSANMEQVEVVTLMDAATDGMMFDNKNNLFLGGLENNSINIYTNQKDLIQLIKDERIKWADSFAKDSEGGMYFTTSQLHIPANQRVNYCIYKINLK